MKKKKIFLEMFFVAAVLLSASSFGVVSKTTIRTNSKPIITIDPESPNGNNGWYITPVDVTFHAYDSPQDSSGLYCIKYRIITNEGTENPEWNTYYFEEFYTEYDFTITLDEDGIHTVEFYAVDGFLMGRANNEGPVHSSQQIGVDLTKPEITLSKERMSISKVRFTANVIDETSGIYVVRFYQNEESEPEWEDTSSPYEFEWSGISSDSVKAVAYDNASNFKESNSLNTPKNKLVSFRLVELLDLLLDKQPLLKLFF